MPRSVTTLVLLGLLMPAPAEGIPAFARRYRVSCSLCHNPIPQLTPFGEQFAGNGFRFVSREEFRDTLDTGDPLLALAGGVPLAFRLDGYAQAYSKGSAVTDFGAPYIIKVLASGTISKTFSYYMYVNLLERGEFGGFEDAILIADDVFGAPVDAAVGQFQVSDPLFKRELRLMFEDYAVYRARIGDEPADLTYDRGAMIAADVGGFTITGEILNGNGIAPAENRQFDQNGFKNFAGHVTRDIAAGLRLGVFGYYGRSRSEGITNDITYFGGDGTFELGEFTLNAQYLHREDENPLYVESGARRVKTDGGFAEVMYRPQASRWHAYGLYNLVSSDAPLLDVRLGGPSDITRYESLTGGAGFIVMRNLKVIGEGMWDFEQERARWTLGFVTAF